MPRFERTPGRSEERSDTADRGPGDGGDQQAGRRRSTATIVRWDDRSGPPASLLLIAGVIVVSWIRLPFYSFGAGPAREIAPLLHVEGAPTYGSAGHLVMTTIRFDKLTALGMLATWIDPDRSVEGEDVVYPPGLTAEEETRRAISQMDQSKIDAAVVVLSMLTDYPKEHGPGALVEAVGSDCPADERLFPGDLIVRIDGEPVDSRREASRLIDAVPIDDPIEFRVDTDGKMHTVNVTRGSCPGIDEPLIGIVLVEPFPSRSRSRARGRRALGRSDVGARAVRPPPPRGPHAGADDRRDGCDRRRGQHRADRRHRRQGGRRAERGRGHPLGSSGQRRRAPGRRHR